MDCGDCTWIAEIAVGFWRLQLDCGDFSHQDAIGLTNCICKLRNFCTLIEEIVVGLWRLQLDCGDCSWIVEIAFGLQRLQLDFGDCSHRHAVGGPTV